MTNLAPGVSIGEYTLEERLGAGGFAEVWKARHHILNQTVAIKLPLSDEIETVFRREIKNLDSVNHPNILKIHNASITNDPPYLVLEYMPGGTLRDRISAGSLSREQIHRWASEILSAVEAAHDAGIVHGDLKPENVLFNDENELKIADFGLSQSLNQGQNIQLSSSLVNSQKISGTLDYMPREVKAGQKPDVRADVYAFGVLLFEMICGRKPDIDEKPSELRAEFMDFDSLFQGCYTKYEKRFASVLDARAVLAEISPDPNKKAEPDELQQAAATAIEEVDEPGAFIWLAMVCLVVGLFLSIRFIGVRNASVLGFISFAGMAFYLFLPDSE